MLLITVNILGSLVLSVAGTGLLLLYRPRDISNECAFSTRLRFDLSFGMGMSDTITMVLRTLSEIDYECVVEIVGDTEVGVIIVVMKFPTKIAVNCMANRDAFIVMKKTKCLRLCDLIGERDIHSNYFVMTVKGRIRFRFLSNSSINSDLNADMYQVTATSARKMPKNGCITKNETKCSVFQKHYCFTTGVVCDGIKHCGVTDWFDERKSECGLPVEYLSYASVIAVVAAMVCALIAAGHVLVRCLPPLASSFFIFNANEDNRLCIDPVFRSPGQSPCDIEKVKRTSLIPISSITSSSSNDLGDIGNDMVPCDQSLQMSMKRSTEVTEKTPIRVPKRNITMRSMTSKIQEKFLSIAGRKKSGPGTSSNAIDA